ncbi:RNA polymerase sigma-70 factor [Fulvivirga kasyanovii]|uniref:RNA polymerase sigma-70 factor n=1 Tax=Fulvivirga kasyanovii TaxID=396812 RepID=A0ABW9RLH6_9BACT|nr:RNA polymerase sigma-70 factor [Fulvivirga kasyanovii]MTI24939.1 RNA polymerase sigma-70 factor [Fulvivirga kasyanovii]
MQEATRQEFETLFYAHHKELCGLAFNIVGDTDAAKDIVQDVFYKLWKNREQVDFRQKMKHYLFKATSHTALNHIRSNKKIVKLEDEAAMSEIAAPAETDAAASTELEIKVREAIDRLPPKCKTIYLLSRHEGMKYKEIAEALELSQKTVENQMGIALQKLRDELKPYLTLKSLIWILLAGLAWLLLM